MQWASNKKAFHSDYQFNSYTVFAENISFKKRRNY